MGYLALSLTVLLAAAAAPVPIYVGPQVRDGFVHANKGVFDSIADVQKELRKDRSFRVVSEVAAVLKLYIIGRSIGPPTEPGFAIDFPGPTLKFPTTGQTGQMPGTSYYYAAKTRRVEAILHAGTYEQPFVAEDHDHDTWGRCARVLAKDLRAWLAANRDRLGVK